MTPEAFDMVPETVTPATALVNHDSPKATAGREKLVVVGTTSRESQGGTPLATEGVGTTTVARRLARLLTHLNVEDAEFARRTGLTASYVSRLLSGDRGQSGEVPKLAMAVQDAYGISGHYWSARVDLDPAECNLRRTGAEQVTRPEEEMGTLTGRQEFGAGAEARAELAMQSARRGDPAEVVRQIMLVEAPANASAAWWLKTYFELVRKYGSAGPQSSR